MSSPPDLPGRSHRRPAGQWTPIPAPRRAGEVAAASSADRPGERHWDLRASPDGAVARDAVRALAEGHVEEYGDRLVVQFWTSPGLPHDLRVRLVGLTFGHPAVRPRRPVLVCVPVGDSDVLTEARHHLTGARSHVAGATCLIEGTVGPTG